MKSMAALPVYKDVVLLGGGHSHVEVLRRFGMKPQPGVRLTVVTPTLSAPYSGMIPGFVSGFYSLQDCHIDLCRLAKYANARVIVSSAVGINTSEKSVLLESNRPPLEYDILSVNVGITPSESLVPGVLEHATPVKPIASFAAKIQRIFDGIKHSTSSHHIVVVGGGAGGVELACALQYRLQEYQHDTRTMHVTLVSKGHILSSLHPNTRIRMLRLLKERDIQLFEIDGGVERVDNGSLVLSNGHVLQFDECLWCTHAKAPEWFKNTGLELDDNGYMLVDEYLQSCNGPGNIFGAGDCVTLAKSPRPKAGVYAVRAGPIIADNIERTLQGKALRPWQPQSSHLNLIACGNQYALMVKQFIAFDAALLWKWKDHIDRTFMHKYGDGLDFMSSAMAPAMPKEMPDNDAYKNLMQEAAMRCGGCGSKIGSNILSSVLKKVEARARPEASVSIEWGDDAAVIPPPPAGNTLLQTIDFFKSPTALQDPYIFGYISAIHSMSDIYAMNGVPTSALALAVLPFALPKKMEQQLYHMMCGAMDALAEADCKLIGGHTSEGNDMSMGFSITGHVQDGYMWKKSGMVPGNDIILTKPLGTGILLAAADTGLPIGHWYTTVIESMCLSNMNARTACQNHSITACTDITGFGLLGHILEMCEASHARCQLDIESIPLFSGVEYCLEQGISSSLSQGNEERSAPCVSGIDAAKQKNIWGALLDPQTSGGLVLTLDPSNTEQCLEDLRRAGFEQARKIGRVIRQGSSAGLPMKHGIDLV